MKGTIMNRSSYIFILPVILLLLGGCSQEELVSAGDNNVPDVTVDENTVTLSFQLAGNASADTRAEYSNEDMMKEEGNVKSLIYAIFYKKTCKNKQEKDLSTGSYHTENTGSNHIYTVSNLRMDWFDENTEIFAVVNAPAKVKAELFTETPPKPDTLTIGNTIIQKLVKDSIERRARKEMYDKFITNQLKNNLYPNDNKLHYKPANEDNYKSIKYTLTTETLFKNYDELEQKYQQTTSAETLAMYDAIIEDLSCRIELYGNKATYNNNINTYTAQEEKDHPIANTLIQEPEIWRYFLWLEYSYKEDLNQAAAINSSRLIDYPLMSGYLALADNVGSVITVPVEHVYSRIWFQFNFTGDISALNSGAKYIDLTGIKVEGLTNEALLFNVDGVNSESEYVSASITNENEGQSPFFGNLAASDQQHYGTDGIKLCYYPEQPDYNTICRYPLKSNSTTEFDMSNARRYYIYSFQRSGNKLTDNPKITLNYSFTEKGSTKITSKTATAYLYDETHSGGKRHHGLLRNYTYGVNCMVNANTLGLELQVTAHDWYTHKVTDIPTFE